MNKVKVGKSVTEGNNDDELLDINHILHRFLNDGRQTL